MHYSAHNIWDNQYGTRQQNDPHPVLWRKGGHLEEIAGEVDDEYLANENDGSDQEETVAETVGETPFAGDDLDEIGQEAPSGAEVSSVADVPELHHDECGEEYSGFVRIHMGFVPGKVKESDEVFLQFGKGKQFRDG